MSDPRNEIDWTDEWLAASILIFAVIFAVTQVPGLALWIPHNT